MKTKALLTCLALVITMSVGCVRREVVYVPAAPPPGPVVVQEAQPAPIVEVVPDTPGYGYVWIPGVWVHGYHGWEWHRGHWRH